VTRTDVVAGASLGNAVFELVRGLALPSGYGGPSGESTVHARIRADDVSVPVGSLPALVAWAGEERLDLAAEVARSPAVFASFVALGLDARVLSAPPSTASSRRGSK
jgi:hypothetical protein